MKFYEKRCLTGKRGVRQTEVCTPRCIFGGVSGGFMRKKPYLISIPKIKILLFGTIIA